MQSYRNDQSDRPESFLRLASRWQAAHFDFSFDQLAFAASHSLCVQFETARTAPERLTDGVSPRCECAGCWANAAVAASIIRIVEKIEARNRFIHRVIGCSPGAVVTPALSSEACASDRQDVYTAHHHSGGPGPLIDALSNDGQTTACFDQLFLGSLRGHRHYTALTV